MNKDIAQLIIDEILEKSFEEGFEDWLEKELKYRIDNLYKIGYKEGLSEYAHWKDGTQYVGTCGTTLKKALERFEK